MSAVTAPTCILAAVDQSAGSLTALARARSLTKVTGDALVACTVVYGKPDDEALELARHRLASVGAEAGGQMRFGSPSAEAMRCRMRCSSSASSVKAIQQQLGHRTATVTLDVYTHLFEGDLEEVMDRLDTQLATETRPERVLGEVVELPHRDETPR